jgi:hypothetical protein
MLALARGAPSRRPTLSSSAHDVALRIDLPNRRPIVMLQRGPLVAAVSMGHLTCLGLALPTKARIEHQAWRCCEF